MEKRYKELESLLTTLFNKLYVPMGSSDDTAKLIYMEEQNHTVIAIATTKDFTCVLTDGTVVKCNTIEEVEQVFMYIFAGIEPIESIKNAIVNAE